MKLFGFLILLGLFTACDPYGFGFKKNPAYVLDEAFQSVIAKDFDAFNLVSGKEALCLYGNANGIAYAQSNLNINGDKVEIKPKILSNFTKATPVPEYVGYWSYYRETYQVDILDKDTKEGLLRVVVECHYGFEGKKKDEYKEKMKLKKYKKRECRLVKIIETARFKTLPMTEECRPLEVKL
jgi:hypothetical protein